MRPIDQAISRFRTRSNHDLATLDRGTTELAIARDTPNANLLHEFKDVQRLWVGGGDANTLECVSAISSLHELALVRCRSELPANFDLPNLRTLLVLDSPEMTSVASLAMLRQIEVLGVAGCKNLQDYSPLGELYKLRELEIGIRRYHEKLAADSLFFLMRLSRLEHLAVFFTSVLDNSIDAIAKLGNLRTLEISNTFARESLARVAARLPSTACAWFQGWQSLGTCPKCNTNSLVMMTGKGQRSLCQNCQPQRFEVKLSEWRDLVSAERQRE